MIDAWLTASQTPAPIPTPHRLDGGGASWWVFGLLLVAIGILLVLHRRRGNHGPDSGGY